MAKNTVYIDVVVDDKGTTKRVAVNAKKLGAALDDAGASQNKFQKQQKGVAGATSNTTKAFAKMTTGIGGGLVPAYATLAANVFALSAAFNFLKSAGDLAKLQQGQVAYSSATGKGMLSLTKNLQLATESQLAFQEAAQAGAIGVAAGLSTAQVVKLGKAAKDTSDVLGRDLTDSFNRLVRGVTKGEPELLDELGIILRLETASNRYAAALGITNRKLTDAERSQAIYLEVIRQVDDKYSELVENIDPNPWQQLAVAFDDIVRGIKELLNDYLAPLAAWFARNPLLFAAVFLPLIRSITGAMLPALGQASTGMAAFGARMEKQVKSAEKLRKKFQSVQGSMSNSVALAQKSLQGLELKAGSALGKLQSGQEISGRSATGVLSALQAGKYKDLGLSKKQAKDLELSLLGIQSATLKTEKAQKKANAAIMKTGDTAVKATGQFSKFGAGIARVGTKLLNAFNIATIVIALGALVYSLFKAMKGVDELSAEQLKNKRAASIFLESTEALNEEFKNFNYQQERLLNKSGDFLSYFDNLSARIVSVSQGFTDLVKNERLAAVFAADLSKDIDKTRDDFNEKAIKAYQYVSTAEGIENVKKQVEEATTGKALISYLAENEGELSDTTKGLSNILMQYEDILAGIENVEGGLDSAALPIREYAKQLKEITTLTAGEWVEMGPEGFRQLVEAVEAAGKAMQNFNTETALLRRTQKDFQDVATDITNNLLAPRTAYESQIAQINSFQVAYQEFYEELDPTKLTELTETYGKVWVDTMTANIDKAQAFKELLESLNTAQLDLKNSLLDIEIASARQSLGKTSGAREFIQLDIALQRAQAEQANAQRVYEIKKLAADLAMLEGATVDAAQQRELLNSEKLLEQAKLRTQEAERAADTNMQVFDAANQALESGLQTNLASIIKGEESSIKDAMLSIAKGMLNAVADTMAKQLTNFIMGTDPLTIATKQAEILGTAMIEAGTYAAEAMYNGITSAVGGFSSSNYLSNVPDFAGGAPVPAGIKSLIPGSGLLGQLESGYKWVRDGFNAAKTFFGFGLANGGIVSGGVRGYASGGLVTRPTMAMIGEGRYNEAVVPLPDGKAIPVNMSGAGQNNNVVVNVSIDNLGNATSNTQQDSQAAGNIGNMIARAVQTELQNQKRSGGILNPYGVA